MHLKSVWPVVLAIIIGLAAATTARVASADVIPENCHYHTAEYVLTGLAAHADYKFVLIGEEHYEDGDLSIVSRVIADGVAFEAFSTHWSYDLTVKLLAVKGNVPERITAEWLKSVDAISIPATQLFPGSSYIDDTAAKHKTRTTYRVVLTPGATATAPPTLSLVLTRTTEYDKAGNVIADRQADGQGRREGRDDSDGDGLPASESPMQPTPSTPIGLLIVLAAIAAAGLFLGLRAIGKPA